MLPIVSWIDVIGGFGAGTLFAAIVAWWGTRVLTARARQAERRARSAEHLAEIGSMTGGLAHEIKNPLSTISLNAELLAEAVEDLAMDDEARGRLQRRLGVLRREVERLGDILSDFLDFAGELRLQPQRVDLNELVGELGDFFLPQARARGVSLRVEAAADPVYADVDPQRLKQALLNLMLNATQAMAADQRDGAPPRELMLRTRQARDGRVRVHVTDTGPGIAPEAADRIFRPYFTTKAGGTGLGLPTARRIIQASGGELRFTSEPGRGTDFVIELAGAG